MRKFEESTHMKFGKLYISAPRKEKTVNVLFGKNEIIKRIAVIVDLVKLVWNDDMFI